ncbi:MAG: DUF1566 domain-containing protein, partial [Nitrospira sp.]|nr:DUF1566 domain-containing protein [Nitrospira sp.]
GWRLPTKEEFEALLSYCESKGISKCAEYYNKIGFKNVQSDYYWSSTSYASSTDNAWVVNIWNGSMSAINKSNNNCYVWPVRSGQ